MDPKGSWLSFVHHSEGSNGRKKAGRKGRRRDKNRMMRDKNRLIDEVVSETGETEDHVPWTGTV